MSFWREIMNYSELPQSGHRTGDDHGWFAMVVIVPLLFLLMWAETVCAGTITVLQQERMVEAEAVTNNNPRTETFSTLNPGIFSEAAHAFSSHNSCLPVCCKCMTFSASASASQDSLIAMTADGALEIRATGLVRIALGLGGNAQASSRLVSTFMVEGGGSYIIDATGVSGASLTLEGPGGLLIDTGDLSAGIAESRSLPDGVYTLTVDASNTQSVVSDYDIRMTVHPNAMDAGLGCGVEMSQLAYSIGETVIAKTLSVENRLYGPLPIELKVWQRLPDNSFVIIRNDGTDGELGIPALIDHDFGPIDIFVVNEYTQPGLHEFGCRILDPVTGMTYGEDRTLFEISTP